MTVVDSNSTKQRKPRSVPYRYGVMIRPTGSPTELPNVVMVEDAKGINSVEKWVKENGEQGFDYTPIRLHPTLRAESEMVRKTTVTVIA